MSDACSSDGPSCAAAVRAIGEGDVAALRALLEREPELVRARTPPPMCATLLHHSAFNGTEELAFAAPPARPPSRGSCSSAGPSPTRGPSTTRAARRSAGR